MTRPRKPFEPRVDPKPIQDVPALSSVLGQIMALRGIGRIRGDRQLSEAWQQVAGAEIAGGSRPTVMKNGVLQIVVTSSALLGELVSFHKAGLLARLQAEHPTLRVRDLKFRLRSRSE